MNAANADKVQAAAQKLADKIILLTPKIMALPDNAQIALQGPYFLTGAQIKELWGKINFLVTDRTDFGMDRGRAVTGFLSQMSIGTVQDWDRKVENGLDFIMLHEMMHMSAEAKSWDAASWTAHLNDPTTNTLAYDGENPHFRSNEAFVNHAAFNLTLAFGDSSKITLDQPADVHPRNWIPPYGI